MERDDYWLISGARVGLRPPLAEDECELLTLNAASAEHYAGWVAPAATAEAFAAYLERSRDPAVCAMLVVRLADSALMGAITLSQIFRGPFQNAYMGYHIGAPFARQGYMREAITLALDYAFGPLGLHRIEANIQPGNAASLALVARLGFTREGYSRRYLRVAGDWRDHERWAMLAEDWALIRSGAQGSFAPAPDPRAGSGSGTIAP